MFDKTQLQHVLERYQGLFPVKELGYGTVRDYCNSCDHIPLLSNYQGDLKDFQRPWTVKAILGSCPPGSQLLEIGAGEPLVAQMLAELGYSVTVVDPYDGSALGPSDHEGFSRVYDRIKILRCLFPNLPEGTQPNSFDAIYSISVLEHMQEPVLTTVFEGIRSFLKPKGLSLHSIDHVTEGTDTEWHRQNLIRILSHQSALAGAHGDVAAAVTELDRQLRKDLETYYLSASGHNLWRGPTPYDQFPFRKVVSILSSVRMNPEGLKRT